MLGYIGRRLLLMIPTLIGITFLVFMLLALSPGGIGAALRVSGGQMTASKAALQEAYLEDRYGLDDPAVVQYFRWLGRISPLKFGARDQEKPSGDLVSAPKRIKPPILEGTKWLEGCPVPSAAEQGAMADAAARMPPEGARHEEVVAAFSAASRAGAKTRADYLVARKAFERALARYAVAAGIRGAVAGDGKIDQSAFARVAPREDLPESAEARKAACAMVQAWASASAVRDRTAALFDLRPFPQVGMPVLPGVSVAAPDLGVAFSRGRPVSDLIMAALPVTILINLVAIPLIYLIAVPTGMLAAARRGTWFDTASGALFVALWSVPTVWAGVMMIGYLADRQYLGLFPVSGLHDKTADAMRFLPHWATAGFEPGYALDTLWHLVLPVSCLVYGGFAVLAKQTRASMLDNANMDFVRTARAKGVPSRDVLVYHIFRNSLLPLITIFVAVFPAMLAGSVVVERIFSIPGMGSLILDAIHLMDRELLLADVVMIAGVNLFALLLADILYAIADPRVTFE